jgi:bifunctional UDP-N-acetylglucosamine pyrophosphorylase/glucosamine-1-phosphate N-acetyltransferase
MVLDSEGLLERIVEERDATPEERELTLVNSGVACWDIPRLVEALPKLKPDNAKREYYLTDVVALLRAHGHPVGVARTHNAEETHGVNTRADLAKAEAVCRRRILESWMTSGVTIVDPDTTYVDADAVLGPDTRLWPGTVIQGASRIAPHCEIGPYTVIESSVVKTGARVGPFAHLRPGTVIAEGAHIGNFVEVKKSRVGRGSKANHLSYIGDSRLGAQVNIGAGTITCNYDGVSKHATIIGDGVFIGSNTNLVAPVRVGRGAIVAAGSTVTDNVPADALAVARTRQCVKTGWAKAWRRAHKK